VCRLIANTDRPEERDNFKISDIEIYAEDHRAEIVQALLMMVRFWIGQGMPAPKGIKLGGFEEYVQVVGGILQSCELTLQKNYREASDALDTERSAIATLCNTWWESIPHDTSGDRTIPQKAGKIWEHVKDVEGLPAKVKDALSLGYFLKFLHERRVQYTGRIEI
jgi:hypothetical protein